MRRPNDTARRQPFEKALFAVFLDPRVDMNSLRRHAENYGFKKICLIGYAEDFPDLEKSGKHESHDYFCNLTKNVDYSDVMEDLKKSNDQGYCPLPREGDAIIGFVDASLPAIYGISKKYNMYPACGNENFIPPNKLEQRKYLSENNLDDQQPKWHEVDVASDESLRAALAHVGFPAVLKTTGGISSQGVYFAKTEDEFTKAVKSARSLIADKVRLGGLDYVNPNGTSSTFVLEECLSHERGKEYCVEGSVFDGKTTIYGIGEKILKDRNDKFTSNEYINIPLDSSEAQKISAPVPAWMNAFKYKNGLFNLDCMMVDGNVKLLEANYRTAGSRALYEEAYGYSTEEALIANAAGKPFLPVKTPTKKGLGFAHRDDLWRGPETSLPFPGTIERKCWRGSPHLPYVLLKAENAEDVRQNIHHLDNIRNLAYDAYDPGTSMSMLQKIAQDKNADSGILVDIAKHPNATDDIMADVMKHPSANALVLQEIAGREKIEDKTLDLVIKHSFVTPKVLAAVAERPRAGHQIMIDVMRRPEANALVLQAIAENEWNDKIDDKVLAILLSCSCVNPKILSAVAGRANISADIITKVMKDSKTNASVLTSIAKNRCNENVDDKILAAVLERPCVNSDVLAAVVGHPCATAKIMADAMKHPNADIDMLLVIALHEKAKGLTLSAAVEHPKTDLSVLRRVVRNKNADDTIIKMVVDHPKADALLLLEAMKHRNISYKNLNYIAKSPKADAAVHDYFSIKKQEIRENLSRVQRFDRFFKSKMNGLNYAETSEERMDRKIRMKENFYKKSKKKEGLSR